MVLLTHVRFTVVPQSSGPSSDEYTERTIIEPAQLATYEPTTSQPDPAYQHSVANLNQEGTCHMALHCALSLPAKRATTDCSAAKSYAI